MVGSGGSDYRGVRSDHLPAPQKRSDRKKFFGRISRSKCERVSSDQNLPKWDLWLDFG